VDPRRQRRGVALLAAGVLVLAGCGPDAPDIDPDLEEIDSLEPEPEPDPEPELEPDPEPEPEAEPAIEDDPAEEGDHDAGVIPESAFEINEDLDADEDAQRAILEAYAEAFRYEVSVLGRQQHFDEEVARAFYSGPALDGLRGSAEQFEADDLLQTFSDTTASYLRVVASIGFEATVEHCIRFGPDDVVMVRQTEEVVAGGEEEHRLLVATLAMTELPDGRFGFTVDEVGGHEDARCA
jgi:hypothetical protein